MTSAILITFCCLFLLAYIFDLTAGRSRIPSVILLLLTGWLVRHLVSWLHILLPELSPLLPVIGTIGLIMIVLEGSLELELNHQKRSLIMRSFLVALIPMMLMAGVLTWWFQYQEGGSLRNHLLNVLPLCVISSAVAIPSVRLFSKTEREFVTYESSFSDILGVTFFNFISINQELTFGAFGYFALDLVFIIAISVVATLLLSILLSRIGHHVKFVPIMLMVLLIYGITKSLHLPGLIFVMIFGLFVGNFNKLTRYSWAQYFRPQSLLSEAHRFREITGEGAFLIRASFFILFGFLIDDKGLLNVDTLLQSGIVVGVIFSIRAVLLLLTGLSLRPLLFIAPRGLITILLFLSILPDEKTGSISQSLLLQVILLSALIMTLGTLLGSRKHRRTSSIPEPDENKSILNP